MERTTSWRCSCEQGEWVELERSGEMELGRGRFLSSRPGSVECCELKHDCFLALRRTWFSLSH